MINSKQKLFKWAGFIAIALLLGVGSVFAFNFPGFGNNSTVKAVDGTVTIPVARISDGKAQFYRFADGGKEIAFFVVKGTDGAPHVAFDACDACYKEKKGYSQAGSFMVCRNCDMKFATNKIGKANNGGCNPSHLDFALSGGNIVIRVDALQTGARFF